MFIVTKFEDCLHFTKHFEQKSTFSLVCCQHCYLVVHPVSPNKILNVHEVAKTFSILISSSRKGMMLDVVC